MLFKTANNVISAINTFLDSIDEGVLVFKHGVNNYLNKENKTFSDLKIQITKILEEKEDDIRKKHIKKLSKLIDKNLNIDKERETLNLHIKKENQEFFTRLHHLNPELTVNEKRLFSTYQIKTFIKRNCSYT